MTDLPNDFACREHGVYGTEWPFPESCPMCQHPDTLRLDRLIAFIRNHDRTMFMPEEADTFREWLDTLPNPKETK